MGIVGLNDELKLEINVDGSNDETDNKNFDEVDDGNNVKVENDYVNYELKCL